MMKFIPSQKTLRIQHRADILDLFNGPKSPWTTAEISKALGLREGAVDAAVKRLVDEGLLRDAKKGRQKVSRWEKV